MYGGDDMKTLKDIIFRDIKVNNNDNYLIFNEGGIGKTTQMKSAYLELIKAHIDKIVPIFIDCKSLNFKSDYPLLSAILEKYCGNDCMESTHRERLEKLICNKTPQNGSYKFIIFIDGINECESNKFKVLQDIDKLLKSLNNKIIVSSRINEDEYIFKDFKKLKVKEFTDEQIITYLDSKGINDNGISIELNRLNPSLLKILRIPMFLKLFANTYSEKHIFPDIYTTNIVRKADLLQGFLDKILNDKLEQYKTENIPEYWKRKFALNLFLPALAFEMSIKSSFAISEKDITDIIDNKFSYEYFKKLVNLNDRKLIKNIDCNDVLDICKDEFSLITLSNKSYAFSHQVWQDFFCAKFYAMCIEYDIIEVFDNSISISVRQFIGEIVKNESGECECDFEKIKDLEKAKKSPINMFLQSHNLNSSKPLSPLQTHTLIEIMKTSRNNNITADYSNLDLKKANFFNTDFSYGKFINTKFHRFSFLPTEIFGLNKYGNSSLFFSSNAISPDGRYAVYSKEANIYVFDLIKQQIIAYNTNDEFTNISIDIRQIVFLTNEIFVVNYEYFICIYNLKEQTQIKFPNIKKEPGIGSTSRFKFLLRYIENLLDHLVENKVHFTKYQTAQILGLLKKIKKLKTCNLDKQKETIIKLYKNNDSYFSAISYIFEKQSGKIRMFESENNFMERSDEYLLFDWALSPLKNKIHVSVNRQLHKCFISCENNIYEWDFSQCLKNDYCFDSEFEINPKKIIDNSNTDFLINWKNKGLIGCKSQLEGNKGCYLSYYDIENNKFKQKFFDKLYLCNIRGYCKDKDIVLFMFSDDIFLPTKNVKFPTIYKLIDLIELQEAEQINEFIPLSQVKLIDNMYVKVINDVAFGEDRNFHNYLSDKSNFLKEAENSFGFEFINEFNAVTCNFTPKFTGLNKFGLASYSCDDNVYKRISEYFVDIDYSSLHVRINNSNEDVSLYFKDTLGKCNWFEINYFEDNEIISVTNLKEDMDIVTIDKELINSSNWNFLSSKVKEIYNKFVKDQNISCDEQIRIIPENNYSIIYNNNLYVINNDPNKDLGYRLCKNIKNCCFYNQYYLWFDDPNHIGIFDYNCNCLALIKSEDIGLSVAQLSKKGFSGQSIQLSFYDGEYLSISLNKITYIFSKSQGIKYRDMVIYKKVKEYKPWKCLKLKSFFLYKDGYFFEEDSKLKYVKPADENIANIYTIADCYTFYHNNTNFLCTEFNGDLSIWDLRILTSDPKQFKPIVSNINFNYLLNYKCENSLFEKVEGITQYQIKQLSNLGAKFEFKSKIDNKNKKNNILKCFFN